MRLKRLTLHGFKTFADRTEIEFAPGVTCIVGPNGSGKSNLLDALVWCLGEQKTSNLRAARAADVIFAGSARRRPMGMAEVSLTVDNEDRFLPLDYSEVTITRRLYRNGDSEYLINKTACRLKDISELFFDTGVGRGAYAIVNQSEIDSILSARPEDRRELFEEAAGIKKYRVKKREAQRKLENVETNLIRVRDIASELATQVEPLSRQAEITRQFNALTERLRAVEVGQLAADYKRLQGELAELEQGAVAAQNEAQALRTEEGELEAASGGLSQRIVDAETRMEEARLAQQIASTQAERLQSRIDLAAERKASAQRTLETLARDLESLAKESALLSAESDLRQTEARAAETELAQKTAALADAEAAARAIDTELAELSRKLAGQQADYLALARTLAAQKAELIAVRERIARRETDLIEAKSRASQRHADAETAKSDAGKLADESARAKDALLMAEESVAQNTKLSEASSSAVVAARERLSTAQRNLAGQQARLRVLEETEAAQEGYFAGVRSVLRGVADNKLSGRFEMVADLISVPARLETAIEVALGGSLQDIVCDSEADAKAAIRFLNDTRGGRATFLPLGSLREQMVPSALRMASRQMAGVLGSAADLVEFDDRIERAVNVLLARILIVEDIDTATIAAKKIDRDWAKIVTLGGEVVVPTGAITGGKQGRPGPNLLSRKREIGELSETVESARGELSRLETAIAGATDAETRARADVRSVTLDAQTARDFARDSERRAQAKLADSERLARESAQLSERADAIARGGVADDARASLLAETIARSEGTDSSSQLTREEMTDRQASLSVRRDEARDTVRALSSEAAVLRERAKTLLRDAERARDGALRATVTARERDVRSEEARAIVGAEDDGASGRETELLDARAQASAAQARFETWKDRRQALLAENFQLLERIKLVQRGVQSAVERALSARLRSARVDAQAESVGQRLLDEYEMHPDAAVALTGGEPVARDVAQEIGRLRREIRGLGAVNAGAIDEYERVSERYRFLTDQKRDLEEARGRLLAAITEIDDSTRGVFVETFQAVGVAFAKHFSRLFGGGTTELVMTDPDDVLETGIDILAQPPGKKRQSLALLSGGERALTATALLFAFLEVRPAPFCVLDEVDAPLDGANVEKFADLVRDFGKESQFILITHNATTMEAAPLWYGVTMQEPGVSKTLSMRVPEPAPADPVPEPVAVGSGIDFGSGGTVGSGG